MSYSTFHKTEDEFKEIFSHASKISTVSNYPDKKINLILSSEHIVGTLKPILETMLESKLDDKKVVLIPNGGIGMGKVQMSYTYLEQFTTINNMYLKQLDILRWQKKLLLEALTSCDVISFSGGYVSNIIQAIDRANIRKEVVEILKKGKPFIGFSGGGMTMSKTTYFAQHFIGEPDPAVVGLKPLGLVDFEVYPHFEDIMLPSIKTMLPNNKKIEAYALRATEAMIVTKGKLRQAGSPIRIS